MRKSNDTFVSGDWNALCDQCGFKYKASELRDGIDRQKGLKVCDVCWDEPNPQDHLRVRPDKQRVPWTRPEPTTDTFLADPTCTIEGRQGVAGQAVAGCSIVGLNSMLADEEDTGINTGTFLTNNGTF